MSLPMPSSLSPSKMSAFTNCALAYRFSAIDRLPEPPSIWTVRGSLVHAALERLFCLAPAERSRDAAKRCVAEAIEALRVDPELAQLALEPDDEAQLHADAEELVERYFSLEDPSTVHAIGLELRLRIELDGVVLSGIIDRLDWEDGELVVTDYKTGRAPSESYERSSMTGIHFYSLLCEQLFGQRPKRIQLLHLAEPVAIMVEPSDKSARKVERTVHAVWDAVARACERDDFRPQPSRLCDFCAYRAYCPTFGGDPAEARRWREERDAAKAAERAAVAATAGADGQLALI
jgi:putative RecB family exonuclease